MSVSSTNFHLYVSFILPSPSVYDTNSNPCGISSFIKLAYASCGPSLYTLSVYVTISVVCTNTGSFEWIYVAVVFVSSIKFAKSTCGILSVISLLSPVDVSVTPVINLRNAKSYILDVLPTCINDVISSIL